MRSLRPTPAVRAEGAARARTMTMTCASRRSTASCRWMPRARCRSKKVLARRDARSEEHTSELQSPCNLVCRLLLEKKKNRDLRGPRLETTLPPHACHAKLQTMLRRWVYYRLYHST